MVEFINYFFVPMIAVALSSTLNSELKTFSLKWVYCYCIYTILVLSVMRVFAKLLLIFFTAEIPAANFSYTLAAAIVSIILPYVVEIFKKMKIDIDVQRNEKK